MAVVFLMAVASFCRIMQTLQELFEEHDRIQGCCLDLQIQCMEACVHVNVCEPCGGHAIHPGCFPAHGRDTGIYASIPVTLQSASGLENGWMKSAFNII